MSLSGSFQLSPKQIHNSFFAFFMTRNFFTFFVINVPSKTKQLQSQKKMEEKKKTKLANSPVVPTYFHIFLVKLFLC